MKRRAFVTGLGGILVLPFRAPAQQAMPVIGWLSTISEQVAIPHQAMFRRGLGEIGFVPNRNVGLEYRWANGQYDRLPALAAELVRLPVDVILTQAPPAALAAKTATTTIPIVFVVGIDPVAGGLVASYSRPGGNATGTTLITGPLGQKRVEILRELAPRAKVLAMLVNPLSPDGPPEMRDVQKAAEANGLQLRTFNASTVAQIDAAFTSFDGQRPDALLVGSDPFLVIERQRVVDRVARAGLIAVYPFREFTEAGGLLSYGTNIANTYRQAGIYVGRILKGAKPAELPVVQPTTFELVINLKAARAQSIDIPPVLHARSDEVIE